MAFKIEEQAVTFRWPVKVRMPKDGGDHEEVEIAATMQHMPPSWRERRRKEAEELDADGKSLASKEFSTWVKAAGLDTIVDLHHIDRLKLLRIVDEDGNEITETTPLDAETKKLVIGKFMDYPHIEQAISRAYSEALSGAENQPKHRVGNSRTPFAN